jgi:hypothetical protein
MKGYHMSLGFIGNILFFQVPVQGWLDAFAAHPRIGDLASLREKHGAFEDLSKNEQAGTTDASADVLQVECVTL